MKIGRGIGTDHADPAAGRVGAYSETWNQTDNNGNQVAAGTYTIVGQITSSDSPQQASTTFTIA
ncbi:hypothetical protein [Tumebacillus sp. BK434]|uniref:hypothetical protein n=1 Tax=Tumebacillus sp. BK434 TaxID=2512169 RepID=UPI001045DF67|nr:hypothetical protein [Tumebacillus sp. BK434]